MATKIFLIAVFAFLSITGFAELVSGIKSNQWLYVEGEITQSTIVPEQASYDNNSFAKPQIVYSYEIEGCEYEGKRIYLGQLNFNFGFGFFANRLIKKYPVGRAVNVYYQPHKESVSVLEPGVKLITILKIVLSIIIAVAFVRNTGQTK